MRGLFLGSWIYEDGAFKVIVQGAIPHGEPWLGIEMLTKVHRWVHRDIWMYKGATYWIRLFANNELIFRLSIIFELTWSCNSNI
jgi:hypothetical protein